MVFKINDLVRELPDGNLEYVCRQDNMFKIRGFRVECSAVESGLIECGNLKEAVAMASWIMAAAISSVVTLWLIIRWMSKP